MNQSLAPLVEPRNPETDFNLLTIIGCAEYDTQAAEAALQELYARHARRLNEAGINQEWEALGIDVEEMVIRTFATIWTHAGRFESSKSYPGKPVETAISLWVYRIFENEFRSELRKIHRKRNHAPQIMTVDDTVLEINDEQTQAEDGDAEESVPETPRVVWTKEWLDTLSERDRKIMILSTNYINPITGKCAIPKDELVALAGQLKLAPASIKVKRKRMMERLRDFIAEKEKTETSNKNRKTPL
jgi:RNA polymerase sigma factor (sigma-70 family)